MPDQDEIKEYYNHEFYDVAFKREDPITLLNRTYHASLIKKYCNGKKVLDVGAGDGSLVNYLKKHGFYGHGILRHHWGTIYEPS